MIDIPTLVRVDHKKISYKWFLHKSCNQLQSSNQLQFNCNPTAIQVQSNCNPTAINCNLTAINCNQALWVHFAYRFLNNKSFHLNSFRFACYAEEKIQYYSICTSIRPSSLVNRLNLVKIRWQGDYNQKYDSCSSDKWTFRTTQV